MWKSNYLRLAGVALFLALGCDTSFFNYLLEDTETYTWPTFGNDVFRAGTINGDISMTVTSNKSIKAVVTKSCLGETKADASDHMDNIVVAYSSSGGEIVLSADMPEDEKREYSADVDVTAPPYMALDLETVNGDVRTENTNGDVSASVVNGDIEMTLRANASVRFEASTENGTVEVSGFGMVIYSVDEANHKIGTVGQGEASIVLTATNGNITLRAI